MIINRQTLRASPSDLFSGNKVLAIGYYPIHNSYFPELGDGWLPAVVETESEMDFITQGQRALNDNRSYRIVLQVGHG